MSIILLFLSLSTNLKHNKVLVRKEIRDLTPEEWATYRAAVLNLKSHGILDDIADIHMKADAYAHNTNRFLPWHRALLLYFESLLQLINNDYDLTVPYWDWTLDCDDPQSSFIFKERFWGISTCFELNYPAKHCLQRNEHAIDPFYTKAQINKLVNKKMSYSEFREALELVPHAIVHFNVGGRDGDMSNMYSTNDPVFWHHHSFIDYIWHKKQAKNLKDRYDGDVNETLLPFKKSVKDVLDLKKCRIVYKEFAPVKMMNVEMKVGKISEEYALRHNYDIKRVREIERFMSESKGEGVLRMWMRRLFGLRN